MGFDLASDSTGSSQNITSTLQLATFTASGTQVVAPSVRLSALNAAAATLTLTMRHYASDGTTLIREQAYSFAKPQASSTVAGDDLPAWRIANGEKLTIAAKSTNASDTAASYTISWLNGAASDVQYVAGTSQTARDLGANLDAQVSTRSTLTAAQAATAVWQDTTAGDFTTAGSIGQKLFTPIVSGTATAGGTSTITISPLVLDPAIDSAVRGQTIAIIAGAGIHQSRTITDYNSSTGVITVDRQWATTPNNTSVFLIHAFHLGIPLTTFPTTGVTFPSGTIASTTNITAGTITTTTNLTNLPSIPANWITAAGITDGAITAAKIAANALTSAKFEDAAFTAAKFAASSLNGKGDWNTTAPDNASITAIKAKTDNLPALPAAVGDIPTAADIRAEIDANSTQLALIVTNTTNIPTAAAVASATATQITTDHGAGAYDSATVDLTPISDQLDEIQAKTDLIGSTQGNIDIPVSEDGTLTIIQGDDYDDSRPIVFTFGAGTPTLSESDTVTLTLTKIVDGKEALTIDGTVTDVDTVSFELTSEETAALFKGDNAYTYRIKAVIAGDDITIQTGSVTVE